MTEFLLLDDFESLFNSFLAAYARSGQHRSALQLLATMQQRGVAPQLHSYHLVLAALAKAQQPQLAEKLLLLFAKCSKHFNESAITEFNALPAAWRFVHT